MMPTLNATDGGTATPIEQIKRVDLTPEDIRKMSDEDLATHLALLRKSRETSPPKAGKGGGAMRSSVPKEQLIDDSDIESDV
jgi:hypothetical protein